MKLNNPSRRGHPRAAPGSEGAFTLPEILTAMTLFVLLSGGIVSSTLFGLKMSRLAQGKLDTTGAARRATGQMADEIRNCRDAHVGNISNGVFVAHLDGEVQSGTGLLIYPTTNTANFIVYFLRNSDQGFYRVTSANTTNKLLAQGVTNFTVFTAQDSLGNVLTNSQNNRVIHFKLEFFQPQPWLPVADFYRLETSVTKRTL